MNSRIHLAVVLIFLLGKIGTTSAQSSYDIVKVSQAETSYNTVTATVYQVNGKSYVYSGGDGNQVDVFRLDDKLQLKKLKSYVVAGGKKTVRGIVADKVHGQDFLFVGLKGGHAVEVYKIGDDGLLTSVFVVEDTDSTYLGVVITLQVIHMASDTYLFVGGLEKSPGMTSFKILPNGHLEHIQSMGDTQDMFMDGIIGMAIHHKADKTYLYTGGFHDNGLSSFRVYEDGRFENVDNFGDDHTRFMNGTYPVISTSIQGRDFVITGHRHHIYYKPTNWIKDKDSYYYHGDAVSVFIVNDEGKLMPRSVFIDNTETLIQGQTRLHKLPIDDQNDLIAVATRDDQSVQLFVLNDKGRLIDAGKIKTGFPIYYGLAGAQINEKAILIAGSVEGNELACYRLDMRQN